MRADVVVVGGGHNGLVAATYLARAGPSVTVLERGPRMGGAAVSFRAFAGVDVRLSRYSYLVSLLPKKIVEDLGLPITLRRRNVSSYTPVRRADVHTGLLVDTADEAGTRSSFVRTTGSEQDFQAWQRFYEMNGRLAERVFPTLTEPLPSAGELRTRVGDERAWRALFEQPLNAVIEECSAGPRRRSGRREPSSRSTWCCAGCPGCAMARSTRGTPFSKITRWTRTHTG